MKYMFHQKNLGFKWQHYYHNTSVHPSHSLGGLGVHYRCHICHIWYMYGTSWTTFHFQHSTGTGSLHVLQVHRDFLLTL